MSDMDAQMNRLADLARTGSRSLETLHTTRCHDLLILTSGDVVRCSLPDQHGGKEHKDTKSGWVWVRDIHREPDLLHRIMALPEDVQVMKHANSTQT